MSVKQAKDAMAANLTAPPTSNIEAQRQGFFQTCEQFGTNAGAGDTSKVGWFQAMTEAAWQGIVAPATRRKKGDTNKAPTDPELAYDAFAEARKVKAGEMGKRIAGKDGKDRTTRVSEANRMITLGSLPLIHDNAMGGLGVFQRTLKIIREDEEITGQVDDMLLDVARRQCEKPEVPLTDAQIKAILMPEEQTTPTDPDEVELWGRVLKRIEDIMNNKFPDSAATNQDAKTARASVVRRIDALGGTQAMVKARAEAKRKEEQEKAKRREVQRQGARSKKKR